MIIPVAVNDEEAESRFGGFEKRLTYLRTVKLGLIFTFWSCGASKVLFLSGYILLCQHDHNAGDHDAYDAGKADQIRCDIPEHPAENPHR